MSDILYNLSEQTNIIELNIINKQMYYSSYNDEFSFMKLCDILQYNQSIQKLTLSNVHIGLIVENHKESYYPFGLSNNEIELLCNALISNTSLHTLFLQKVYITKKNALKLVDLLTNNHTIKRLYLTNVYISYKAFTILIPFLKNNSNLDILEINNLQTYGRKLKDKYNFYYTVILNYMTVDDYVYDIRYYKFDISYDGLIYLFIE